MLSHPSVREIGSPDPMKEIRAFFESRVGHWDDAAKGSKPRWDVEVIATGVTLAINDAGTTGKLHSTTLRALDRIWTPGRADGAGGSVADALAGLPPLRRASLASFYATLAATVFVAGESDDLNVGEQVEPTLSSAMGVPGASVPGFEVAGAVLANCVLSGSADAFLALHVGMVAKRCCGAIMIQNKSALCRAATAEAAGHRGSIATEGTAKLTGAIRKATVGKVGDAVTGASGYAKNNAGSRLWAKVSSRRFEQQPEVG